MMLSVCQPLSMDDLNGVHTSVEEISGENMEGTDNNSFDSDSTIKNSPVSDSEIDPFKSTSQIMNSPVPLAPKADDDNIVLETFPEKNIHVEKLLDSLNTSNHLLDTENPHGTISEAEISKSEGGKCIYNVQELAGDSFPSADACSGAFLDDPFKPKSQLNISLTEDTSSSVTGFGESIETLETSQKIPISPTCIFGKYENNILDVDPFKSLTIISNSPPLSQNKDSELKPQVGSSEKTSDLFIPELEADEVLMSGLTDSQKPGTPGILEETFGAMGNSLETVVDVDFADPFESRPKVSNSVQIEKKIDSENSDLCVAKLGNFDSLKLYTVEGEIDNQDPFEPTDGPLTVSSFILDDFENEDPFESKSPIQNFPNSFDINNALDPFEQICNVPNSPEIAAVNPFKTVLEIPSFSASSLSQNGVGESRLSDLMGGKTLHCTYDFDPFERKSNIHISQEMGQVSKRNNLVPIDSDPDDLLMMADFPMTCEAEKTSDTIYNHKERQLSGCLEMGQGFLPVREQMPFDLPPPLTNVDNFAHAMDEIGNEIFYPASQVFSDPAALDMLEQFGKVENTTESNLSRISLYVKFDPLVTEAQGKTPNQRRISFHPKQMEILKELGNKDDNVLLFGTPSKDMQMSPLSKTPRNQKKNADHKPKENAKKPIVDLLMCSPEEKKTQSAAETGTSWDSCALLQDDPAGTDAIVEVLMYSEKDWRAMMTRMKMQFQGQTLSKEKEWCLALSEKEMALEASQARDQELEKDFGYMNVVISEYEKMINEMIGEKEKCKTDSKDSLVELKKERDQGLQDVQTVQKAFVDLLRRYEKSKAIVDGFKKNEEALKSCLDDGQSKIRKLKETMQSLKSDAEEKIEKANKEIERLHTHFQSEKNRYETLIKREDMQIQSLEKNNEKKVKENQELIELLDSMMAKLA